MLPFIGRQGGTVATAWSHAKFSRNVGSETIAISLASIGPTHGALIEPVSSVVGKALAVFPNAACKDNDLTSRSDDASSNGICRSPPTRTPSQGRIAEAYLGRLQVDRKLTVRTIPLTPGRRFVWAQRERGRAS